MMKVQSLSALLSSFFLRYLALERGVSPHTSASYRDAIKLLLQFSADRCKRPVDRLTIEDLNAPAVLEFLAYLETGRSNTVRSRNARLAAIQTFFRYVTAQEPSLAALCSSVLAIPTKKALRPVLGYLSEQELGALFAQVDRSARHGERDYVLLSILYDTGARIQELLDLKPSDFHFEPPPFVRIRGKGRKERLCPLLPQSAQLVRKFLVAHGRPLDQQEPLLQNARETRLGRHGARYILLKYRRRAAGSIPSLARATISPHTLRHTKAMHLLQSGVPLVMVKDFLGHADLKSTEIYVQADLEMKRKALELGSGPRATQPPQVPLPSSLIEWLESL
ncbi:MAG TPA: tyrosine-type recombinase/integrase [Terriglobales bacterium]|nr:tyrosine-type recombinase/integrase [Terriglobales bacterium]